MSSVIRDFSQEAVANIRELIKENVDEEKQFFLWDWIDDTFKMDDLNIYDYLDNVSKYQSHMVDKHNINSKKFDTILDRVKNVDVNYANRFNKIYENMILYNKKIVNVANMISPEGITVNSDIYNGVINKFNEIYSDKKIDYLQSDLDDLENEMPVIRDIPWYEKALNGVGGTLVSLARDNIEGIAFIPYGIVDLIFGSNLNYNLSQKLDNAEEYLIKNVVTDKQSYHYGKAVGNAICVAEGIICTIAGAIILVGGVTISAVGTAASATGAGIVVGGVAIAISVPVVAVGTAITAVGGNMMLSSADNFKENISKANKVEVDDLKQKEDIKKLDDGLDKSVEKVNYGDHFTKVNRKKILKPNVSYETIEGYKYKTNDFGAITEVEGTLKLGDGNRNPYAQRMAGSDYRLPDDDGGHLIASQFLGSSELDNLVPMNSQINRLGGKWYNMEQEWASALKEGKEVNVKIEPIYDSDNLRPISFKVKYTINGQRAKIIKILNQAGG